MKVKKKSEVDRYNDWHVSPYKIKYFDDWKDSGKVLQKYTNLIQATDVTKTYSANAQVFDLDCSCCGNAKLSYCI